jgi:hypothetical protein
MIYVSINSPFVAKTLAIAPLAIDVAVKDERLHELARFQDRECYLELDGNQYQVRSISIGRFSSHRPGTAFCSVAIEMFESGARNTLRNHINTVGPKSITLINQHVGSFVIL